ncbi:MAG: hypothetical protein ACFWUL_01825 [Dialister sp.]
MLTPLEMTSECRVSGESGEAVISLHNAVLYELCAATSPSVTSVTSATSYSACTNLLAKHYIFQKLVVILPSKRPFNIWRGKSGALLRAGDFHKSMILFPNPRQETMSEKKISCLRRGSSFTRPAPVRKKAVSRILQPARQSFTNTKTRNIATTISTRNGRL